MTGSLRRSGQATAVLLALSAAGLTHPGTAHASPSLAQAVDIALLSQQETEAALGLPVSPSTVDRWTERGIVTAGRAWPAGTGPTWVTLRGYPTQREAAAAFASAAASAGLVDPPEAIIARGAASTAAAMQLGQVVVGAACAGSGPQAEACALQLLHAQGSKWAATAAGGVGGEQVRIPSDRQLRRAVLPSPEAEAISGSSPGQRRWVNGETFPLPGSVVAAYSWPEASQGAGSDAQPVAELVALSPHGTRARALRAWKGALQRLEQAGWAMTSRSTGQAQGIFANPDSGRAMHARAGIAGGVIVLAACVAPLQSPAQAADACAGRLYRAQEARLRQAAARRG